MNEPAHDLDHAIDSEVADLLDEFTDRLNRGEEPDIGDYLQRCPGQSAGAASGDSRIAADPAARSGYRAS